MLELKNICYEVEDNKEIIRDISLQIEEIGRASCRERV